MLIQFSQTCQTLPEIKIKTAPQVWRSTQLHKENPLRDISQIPQILPPCVTSIIPKFQFNIIPEESTRVGEVLPQQINCYAAATNPSEDDQTKNFIASTCPKLSQEKSCPVFVSEENTYKSDNVWRYYRPQRS